MAAHVHAGVTALELDMPELERIDSIGLAALHQAGAFTAARGVILSVVPSPALLRALLDAHLLEEFTLTVPRSREMGTRPLRLPEDTAPGQIIATSRDLALRLPTSEVLPHVDYMGFWDQAP